MCNSAVADAVRKLRSSAGLSQEAFAGSVGSTLQTVSRWERGHFRPDTDSIIRLRDFAILQGKPDLADQFSMIAGYIPGYVVLAARRLRSGVNEAEDLNLVSGWILRLAEEKA